MTKEELRAKYARIPTDFSEIEMLKNQLLDSGLLEAAQVDSTQAGKVFGVLEDGSIGLVEGGGSAQTPVKGGYVLIDGHKYLVLDANEDLTEVKLMFADLNGSKYWDSGEEYETFTTADGTKQGLKYAGSTLDTYCNETFLATLPQEVQDAIIEQTVVQDMYSSQSGTPEEEDDFGITATWGVSYRVNKVNTESIVVGTRKIRSLCVADLISYLGDRTTDTELNNAVFGFGSRLNVFAWLSDACSDRSYYACSVYGSIGSVNYGIWGNINVVRPTFTINWKAFN